MNKIIFLILSLMLITPAIAISTINIPNQRVNLDDTFTIYLNVEPGTNISGMQTNIKYNSSIIKIDEIKEGNLFTQNNRTTFFNAGIINNSNIINIFGVILGNYSINTPGTFIEIRGTPLMKGISDIEIYNIILAKPDATAEEISYINGSITIGNPSWDVNDDGIVNILDVQIVASHFGETSDGRWNVNKIPPVNILDLAVTSAKIT